MNKAIKWKVKGLYKADPEAVYRELQTLDEITPDAVVRNEIATWGTKLDATVFPLGIKGDLIPIDYTDHYVVKKLMQPKKGKPVLSTFNVFKNWKAMFRISYIPNVYSLEQIINIINLAGFGLGIGSRRPCGYGRYTVTNME